MFEVEFFRCFIVYSDAGIDLNKPVIGMCIGGMSSCTLVLTAHLCGCPDVALYHVRRMNAFSEKTKLVCYDNVKVNELLTSTSNCSQMNILQKPPSLLAFAQILIKLFRFKESSYQGSNAKKNVI